jgi:hypothetical protein
MSGWQIGRAPKLASGCEADEADPQALDHQQGSRMDPSGERRRSAQVGREERKAGVTFDGAGQWAGPGVEVVVADHTGVHPGGGVEAVAGVDRVEQLAQNPTAQIVAAGQEQDGAARVALAAAAQLAHAPDQARKIRVRQDGLVAMGCGAGHAAVEVVEMQDAKPERMLR